MIEEYKTGTIMNRRGEWGQNLPPKLTIEDVGTKLGARGRLRTTPTGPRTSLRTTPPGPIVRTSPPQRNQGLISRTLSPRLPQSLAT